MTLPAQDIVERLRERAAAREFGAEPFFKEIFVEWQAADTISRLTADNEALRKEADKWKARWQKQNDAFEVQEQSIAALHARAQEVERLKGALIDIADSDDIDNALDPARNKRVARAALGGRP